MNVLVIGSGAIACFYGALLAKAGASVSFVARSDLGHIRQHGVRVHGKIGEIQFAPHQVVADAAELEMKPDYVLLCVKVVPDCDRVALLRHAVGPDTAIVLIANGIDIEQEIAEAFPSTELISGLAFICVTRTSPGQIHHQAYGRLALGNYPRGASDKALRLCQAFESAGIPCVPSEDVSTARWQKCVWNAAFSPLSVLSGGLGTSQILDTQGPFVRAIMREVCALAAATGHTLPGDIIQRNVDSTAQMPSYKTSMLLDFEAGRPMETEAILGNAVRVGLRLGVPIPHLESIYALMKLRELRLAEVAAAPVS